MELKPLNLNSQNSNFNFYDWAKTQSNIVFDPGINWGTVHFLTEEQKDCFVAWYTKSNFAPRYDVSSQIGLLGDSLSSICRIRSWFTNANCYPGKKEKQYIISLIKEAMETNKFTGISPEAYPELLDRLNSIPDTEDVKSYHIHYHY